MASRPARRFAEMQPILAYVARHLDQNVSLAALAQQAGLSEFHLQRVFAAAIGESPKQLTLRLRLGRAAVLLLTTVQSILDIALDCGFQSHEAFTRAFRQRFGLSPRDYRDRGFVQPVTDQQVRDHATVVNQTERCIGLYRMSEANRRNEMSYTITEKNVDPQPALVVRRKVSHTEIAATIGASLPLVFQYAQANGIALTGLPFTRYGEMSMGMMTIEPGMRVASAAGGGVPALSPPPPDSQVSLITLPGGPVASTIHVGAYDKLGEAYAALEKWIAEAGRKPAGGPWELYLTDPGDHPDPKDWKTEVIWPLAV